MSWRGTLLLAFLAVASVGLLIYSQRSPTRTGREALLRFDPEKAEKITIRNGTGPGDEIVLTRSNGIWRMQAPLADRADPSAINSLLGNASGVTPLDSINPSELKGSFNLGSLELKKPKRIVTIEAGGNHTIFFGTEGATPSQRYSRVDGDPTIYLVSAETASLAFRPAGTFRDPRLTMLSTDHLEEVTLSRKGGLQELGLTAARQEWRIVTPLSTTADHEAACRWVDSIVGAKIDRWMPGETDPSACGLDAPEAVITLRCGLIEPLRIMLGSETQGSPGSRYATCSDRPGICVLKGINPVLEATPASLRSKTIKRVPIDAVDRIRIRRDDADSTLMRKPQSDDWIVVEHPEKTLSGAAVEQWFASLEQLVATGFEAATPEHLQARGLSPAKVTIRLTAHLSENTAEEAAGDMVLAEYAFGLPKDGVVALREETSPELMIVPERALELAKGPKQLQ